MNDEQRRLLLARETWRTMCPSETDIRLGAERVARTIRLRRPASALTQNLRLLTAGVAAAAGVALAGGGGPLLETHLLSRWRGPEAHAVTEVPVQRGQARTLDEPRVGADPNRLPRDPEPLASAAAPAKKKAKGEPVSARGRRRALTAATPGARGEGQPGGVGSNPIGTVGVGGATREPTWNEVSNALSQSDPTEAEKLLLELADRGHDADTRAKANLGLAQLAAARGDCERARVLALGVAAVPGIEMKTIRRALELGVRCAR